MMPFRCSRSSLKALQPFFLGYILHWKPPSWLCPHIQESTVSVKIDEECYKRLMGVFSWVCSHIGEVRRRCKKLTQKKGVVLLKMSRERGWIVFFLHVTYWRGGCKYFCQWRCGSDQKECAGLSFHKKGGNAADFGGIECNNMDAELFS